MENPEILKQFIEELQVAIKRERENYDSLQQENSRLNETYHSIFEKYESSLKNQDLILKSIKKLEKEDKVDFETIAEDIEVLKESNNTHFDSLKEIITNASKDRKEIAKIAIEERKVIFDKFEKEKEEMEEVIENLEKTNNVFTNQKTLLYFLLGLFIGGASDFVLFVLP